MYAINARNTINTSCALSLFVDPRYIANNYNKRYFVMADNHRIIICDNPCDYPNYVLLGTIFMYKFTYGSRSVNLPTDNSFTLSISRTSYGDINSVDINVKYTNNGCTTNSYPNDGYPNNGYQNNRSNYSNNCCGSNNLAQNMHTQNSYETYINQALEISRTYPLDTYFVALFPGGITWMRHSDLERLGPKRPTRSEMIITYVLPQTDTMPPVTAIFGCIRICHGKLFKFHIY